MKYEILTKEFLEAHKTPKGGYKRAQLALIGVAWPPEKYWQNGVIGHLFPAQDLAEFASLGAPPFSCECGETKYHTHT